jgi:curved DNA-binding protein
MGGLGKILRFIPGPIGKIGMGLKIAQVVGSSLFALHKMNQQNQGQSGQRFPPKPESPMMNGIKGMFGKQETSLDMGFYLSIPPSDALKGTHKKISYQVSGKMEQLMVRIPPNFPSGGKLRIKNKGKIYDDKRGDLILSINVDKNVNPQ